MLFSKIMFRLMTIVDVNERLGGFRVIAHINKRQVIGGTFISVGVVPSCSNSMMLSTLLVIYY